MLTCHRAGWKASPLPANLLSPHPCAVPSRNMSGFKMVQGIFKQQKQSVLSIHFFHLLPVISCQTCLAAALSLFSLPPALHSYYFFLSFFPYLITIPAFYIGSTFLAVSLFFLFCFLFYFMCVISFVGSCLQLLMPWWKMGDKQNIAKQRLFCYKL